MHQKEKGAVTPGIEDGSGWVARIDKSRHGGLLAVFLIMALEAFAAFFNGAYFLSPMTLLVVGFWVIAAFIYATTWRLQDVAACRLNMSAALILMLFWLWTGISVFWALSPNLAWVEFNRTGGYLAVFLSGLLLGRKDHAREVSVFLFVLCVAVVGLYALGVKALPSAITNTQELARISVPVGYTNHVGLFMVLSIPLALYLSARAGSHWLLRLTSFAAIPLSLIVLFYTFSRGGFLAMVVGLASYFIMVPCRLRSFGILTAGMIPVVPIVWWSAGNEALMGDTVELALREAAASELRLMILALFALMIAVYSVALLVGKRVAFKPGVTRAVGYGVTIIVAAAVLASAVLFVGTREPSFVTWVKNSYVTFQTRISLDVSGAERLIVINNSPRWLAWNEAVDNWEENLLTGSGAQSFPITHLVMREENASFLKQPHGLPFRLLSELGTPGMLLVGVFIAISMVAGALVVYLARERWRRSQAVALLSSNIIYLVHTAYDWDWNVMAVTIPYFLFAGMLMGWYAIARTDWDQAA